MKKWARWINPATRGCGQALVELAVFGSIVLFCLSLLLQYGLSINYSQFHEMVTFRRAVDLATQRSKRVLSYGPVSLTAVSDKSIPSPDDPHGVRDNSPYTSEAMLYISEDLYGQPAPWRQQSLPGKDYFINGQWMRVQYSGGNPELKGNSTPTYDQPGILMSNWRSHANPCSPDESGNYPVYRKIEMDKTSFSKWWKWVDVPCQDVGEGKKYGEGVSLDVDNDFIEETVMEFVYSPAETIYDEWGNPISTNPPELISWTILDPKQGDMNPAWGKINRQAQAVQSYTEPKEIQEGSETKVYNITVVQGLPQGGYGQDTDTQGEGTYQTRSETPTGITNAGGVNSTQVFSRTFLLNRKGPWTSGQVPDSEARLPTKDELPQSTHTSTLHQEGQKTYYTPF